MPATKMLLAASRSRPLHVSFSVAKNGCTKLRMMENRTKGDVQNLPRVKILEQIWPAPASSNRLREPASSPTSAETW
jgi:hypothetical protein